jgi:hypothetical protein
MESFAMNEQPFVLDEDSIRAKAYELWQSRGGSCVKCSKEISENMEVSRNFSF